MRDKVDRMLGRAAASAMLIAAAQAARLAVEMLDQIEPTTSESIESLADELGEMASSLVDTCHADLNEFGPPSEDDDDFTDSEFDDFGDCHFGDDDDDE